MTINPYEAPKEGRPFQPRDQPLLRFIVRVVTALLAIVCGIALALLLILTLGFSGVNKTFNSLGMSDGLFFGGSSIISIIIGAFVTFFIQINLSIMLLRLFGIQESVAPATQRSDTHT